MTFAKYKLGEDVEVSGTLTGLGDQRGSVIGVVYDKLSSQFFYNVQCGENRHYAQERFVSTVQRLNEGT
ncbi:hypothetical protein DP923_16410 [Pontibacter arcticus]|uniref:Uncharacterized protein n=1 Tax=Pontibacter arcticus TaxID=2080288 RepID=A0A364RAT5_9BACT|nr:hypothetical protein DP923_16065 [Pontibacter arcticus]RAU81413.1 hypothetical protein DP923_16410 [Pontibacter arcticus]